MRNMRARARPPSGQDSDNEWRARVSGGSRGELACIAGRCATGEFQSLLSPAAFRVFTSLLDVQKRQK